MRPEFIETEAHQFARGRAEMQLGWAKRKKMGETTAGIDWSGFKIPAGCTSTLGTSTDTIRHPIPEFSGLEN